MSKKSKRQVSRSSYQPVKEQRDDQKTESTVRSPSRENSTEIGSERTFSSTANGRTTFVMGEFRPDYSIIINDIKQTGILAGSFVVILIALSFFI